MEGKKQLKQNKLIQCVLMSGMMIGCMIVCMLISGCGTNLETHDKNVSTSEHNNELASIVFDYYAANDGLLPNDNELKAFSRQADDTVKTTNKYLKKEKELGIKSDNKEIETRLKESMANIDQTNKADRKMIYQDYHTNRKQFKAYMKKKITAYEGLDELESKCQKQASTDPKLFLDKKAGTINGESISYERYYFYYLQDQMAKQMTQSDGQPSKSRIFNSIAADMNITDYCKKENITIKQSDIDKQYQLQKKAIHYLYPTDKKLQEAVMVYGFTASRFDKDLKQYSKTLAYQNALKAYLTKNAKPDYKDIESYYKKHYVANEKTIIFLYHAVLNKKTDADDLYELSKNATSEKAFKKIVTQYKREHKNAVAIAEELSNVQRGELSGPFGKAAFNAKVGKTFGPVKTEYGYHVGFVFNRDEDIKTNIQKKYKHLYQLTKESMGKTAYNNVKAKDSRIRIDKIGTIVGQSPVIKITGLNHKSHFLINS